MTLRLRGKRRVRGSTVGAATVGLIVLAGCGSEDGSVTVVGPEAAPTEDQGPEPTTAEPEPAPTGGQDPEPTTAEPEPGRDSGPEPTTIGPESPEDAGPTNREGDPVISDVGLVIKEIGEGAGMTSSDTGDVLYDFAIMEVVVNIECTSPDDVEPENGHYVGFYFDVITYPALDDDEYGDGLFIDHTVMWVVDENGDDVGSVIGNARTCMNSDETVPVQTDGDEQVEGWIVLDVPVTTGTLEFEPGGFEVGGWQWDF